MQGQVIHGLTAAATMAWVSTTHELVQVCVFVGGGDTWGVMSGGGVSQRTLPLLQLDSADCTAGALCMGQK